MCHHIVGLDPDELREALRQLEHTGRATFTRHRQDEADRRGDAFPGSNVPIVVRDEDRRLKAALLTWGFWGARPTSAAPVQPGSAETQATGGKIIFNTRLDTAARQMREGRGMWARAIEFGRCLVPVRAFFETSATETAVNPQTGRTVKRPYRFTLAGQDVFLLAGIAEDGRFSIVTTEANPRVAPIHHRMPLVLGPGESNLWLDGAFDRLANRDRINLLATPDDLR